MEGIKNDKEKSRYDLLPAGAIDELAKVLTHGAKKYEANNWRKVENGKERYLAALLRHAFALVSGEEADKDSGLHHAGHIMANAAFLFELTKEMGGYVIKEECSHIFSATNLEMVMASSINADMVKAPAKSYQLKCDLCSENRFVSRANLKENYIKCHNNLRYDPYYIENIDFKNEEK